MSRIVVALVLITGLLCFGISSCSWMGRTTGKAVRGVERGADDFQKGYDQGHGGTTSKKTTNKKPEETKNQ